MRIDECFLKAVYPLSGMRCSHIVYCTGGTSVHQSILSLFWGQFRRFVIYKGSRRLSCKWDNDKTTVFHDRYCICGTFCMIFSFVGAGPSSVLSSSSKTISIHLLMSLPNRLPG